MNNKHNLFFLSLLLEKGELVHFTKPQPLSTRLETRAKESNEKASNMEIYKPLYAK